MVVSIASINAARFSGRAASIFGAKAIKASPVKVCKTLKRLVFCILMNGVKDTQLVGVLKIPKSE